MASRPWWSARSVGRARACGCAYRAGAAIGANVRRKIAILGATGSIGSSTLDLVERSPERFEVVAVTAATNVDALADIARRTDAKLAVIADESKLNALRGRLAGSRC